MALAIGLSPVSAQGSPFEGAAPLEVDATRKARAQALEAARLAAFDAAAASLGSSVEAAALASARRAADVWTSSYRVLEFGGQAVRVQVEIDIPRLRKRLTAVAAPSRRAYRLGAVQLDAACPSSLGDEAAWAEGMRAAGLPVQGDEAGGAPGVAALELRVELSCEALGTVVATHLQAAKVQLRVVGTRGRSFQDVAYGFAIDPAHASEGARDIAIGRLFPQIAAAFEAPMFVRVTGVGDGSRVRRLERAILDGVVTAHEVAVVGLEAGGAVLVGVHGPTDAEQLARALGQLEFPDFRIEVQTNADGESVDVEIM